MGTKTSGVLHAQSWTRGPLLSLAAAFILAMGVQPSFAAEVQSNCEPIVARLVSAQGVVEIRRRAGSNDWVHVDRLDTPICAGDLLRTGSAARAALFVQSETLVRVDQNTTVSLTQTPEETIVEFFQDEAPQSARDARACGAGYFISRFPKKLKVRTPYVNAAVEGTEFQVALQCENAELVVVEGTVRSHVVLSGEDRELTSGESLTAGPASPPALKTVVKPMSAVQWALYYPPLSSTDGTGVPTAQRCRDLPSTDESCSTQPAEALLRAGRPQEALASVDDALTRNPADADAIALRAVIEIARNEVAAAKETAASATVIAPSNYRAWVALSYAQQGAFELEPALDSARKAQALEPQSALTNARVAELLMSLGRVGEAEAEARRAVQANPADPLGHTVLGFVHLAKIETKAARADFEAAVQRDSFEPLARLGLGLAIIRGGKLAEGREQLEIAVALDPSNSLLRSYVGKAYYEENSKARDGLAATQFALAKQLDPNDPTPSFYNAMLLNTQTKPAEALQDLTKSAALNDDRAVYRSRLLLDQDLASRNASQATIYNELGFEQLGLVDAAESLAVDPGNGSAHRFLADIDSTVPRYEIARASELLQAQLWQPLGAPPLQAQLANDIAFKNAFFGPAAVGLNEFNPLFIRNGEDLQIFGMAGDTDKHGDQVIVNGLHGPVSFSLSQFYAHSDGYRANNDETQRQYDGFLQSQLGDATSAQVEVTHSKDESGDLESAFDSTFFSRVLRNEEDLDTQRFGLRQSLDASSDILFSVIRQSRRSSATFKDPDFPATLDVDQDSWKAESQYVTSRESVDVILGASYFGGRSDLAFITPFFTQPVHSNPHHFNGYAYAFLPMPSADLQAQLGLSYDDLYSEVGHQSKVNPKLGVIWKPLDFVTVRAAGFRVLKRRINSDQGLEPTQLAGFNQFFDDDNGTVSEGGGLGVDLALSPTVAAGLQGTRRDLKAPVFDLTTGSVRFQYQIEKSFSGYLYWLVTSQIAVSVDPVFQEFDDGAAFQKLKLDEVPITTRYFFQTGLSVALSVTRVWESGKFVGSDGLSRGTDDFWMMNAALAYRLPARAGTISLEATNLSDETFQFQEVALGLSPRYVPERQVLLRVSFTL